MDEIEEIRKKRFQYLHRLWEATGGDVHNRVGFLELGEQLGFDQNLTLKITDYLYHKGWARPCPGGGIVITYEGIEVIEEVLFDPKKRKIGFELPEDEVE